MSLKGIFQAGYNIFPPPSIVYYPEDYGAIGDGVADDTAAIQAAIDTAAVSGGTVRLEKSYGIAYTATTIMANYPVPYGVWVANDNVSLTGSGTLKPITAAQIYSLIVFGNPGAAPAPGDNGNWVYNTGVFGLSFDGTGYDDGVRGIAFFYCKGFYVINCRFNLLSNCAVFGMSSPREGRIIGNHIYTTIMPNHTDPSISLDGGRNCIIESNYIHNTYGLGINIRSNLDNLAAGVSKFNSVIGNIIDDPYNIGINIDGSSYSIISDNYIWDAPTQGIKLNSWSSVLYKSEASWNSVTNNYIIRSSPAGIGISLQGENVNLFDGTPLLCRGNHVSGNFIEGNYTTKIALGQQSNSNFITDDNIWDTPGTFVADDATPSVSTGFNVYRTANVNATTITMLDDGYVGQRVTVIINDALTTVDFSGTNLKGNVGVDWTPDSGDHMDCVFDGTNWYCIVSDDTA